MFQYEITTARNDPDSIFASAWRNIEKDLSQLSADEKPLLLFVWDEARSLVEAGINGKKKPESSISKFELLRETLLSIGSLHQISEKSPVRLFTIFTDTKSKIKNC